MSTREAITDYLDACLGDTAGRLHIAVGYGGHFNGTGSYEFDRFIQSNFAWPGEAAQAVREMLAAAPESDVYVCSYAMHADKRTPAAVVARDHVHADIDHDFDLDKIQALHGFAVASGTPGHGQVYAALTESVPANWHKVLCRGLADHLGGGDAKISANDVLRPPGTFNHKPAAKGGTPAPVQWLVRPPGVRTDPQALARLLGVTLPDQLSTAVDTSAVGIDVELPVEFNVDDHPKVKAALQRITNDRSADTMRVVGACRRCGLTRAHARHAVNTRPDLAGRLAERHDDDIAECWRKTAKRRHGDSPLVSLDSALATFKTWLHIDDTAPVLAVAAAIVANLAEGDPVWFLILGPPSGGKTEILSACLLLDYVVPAATITEAALLSGTSRKERAKDATGGLMRQIGDFGILLAKDFTSVLSQNKDTAKAAMAAMREIFDGSWDRPVGTDGGKVLHWHGKCGFVGGATPSYDRYGGIVNALGDRFMLLRLPDVDPAEQAGAALKAAQHEKKMRAELATAMLGLIAGAQLNLVAAVLGKDEEQALVALSTFTARARTAVERDGYTGELLVMPQPEGPARLVKAMRQLYGALNALGVGDDTRWEVMARIAVDCVPAIRVPLMLQLLGQPDWRRTADIAEAAGLVSKTAARHLDDLVLLGLAERTKKKPTDKPTDGDSDPAGNSPYYWRRSDWLYEHWPPSLKVRQRTTTRREREIKEDVENNDQ